MLERLQEADALDWSRTALDSASLPAKKGAPRRVRSIHPAWAAAGLCCPSTMGVDQVEQVFDAELGEGHG